MVFDRFVEAGRVVLVTGGVNQGKAAVIVDIVDQKRVLVENPVTGIKRHALALKHLELTEFRVELVREATTEVVKQAMEAEGVMAKWEGSRTARRMAARKIREGLNDFERFKVQVLKRQRRELLSQVQ